MSVLSRKLLGVEVMTEDQSDGKTAFVSANVRKENDDFREFAERMESAGKVYFLVDKNGVSKQLSCDDGVEGAPQEKEATQKQWLDCCLRDYLQRKQQFDKRCGSRQMVAVRILGLLVPFLAVLWFFWPLWSFLIDIDAEVYFKTLDIKPTSDRGEVKRAYRAQVKRWHPDRNPGCGEPCRAQMRKVQQAHDVLMSRGDHRMDLANRYRQELLQVRSLIFFRVYEMASNAAQEHFNIITKLSGGTHLSDSTTTLLRMASSFSTILFFMAYEILFVGGFNITIALQVFFLMVSMVTSTKREGYVAKARKVAYVDLLREAAVMILPLAVGGFVLTVAAADTGDRWEEAFRVAFGCFYVAAYLYRFMPNLYDNMRKRSCTISMNYFRVVTEPVVTATHVGAAELGFLVDDLFAFTCRVPSAFRLVVFVSHFIYLCQFAMLPWEGPLRVKTTELKKSKNASQGREAEAKNFSNDTPHEPQPAVTSRVAAPKYLSPKELGLVADLDNERTDWRTVAAAPYRKLQLEEMVKYAQRHNVMPLGADVVGCNDFQSVAIVVTVSEGDSVKASVVPAPQKPGTAPPVKHDVVHLIKDPVACQMLALCSGPLGMVPAPNGSRDVNDMRRSYAKMFGRHAARTASDVWRMRSTEPPNVGLMERGVPAFSVTLSCFFFLFLACFMFLFGSGYVTTPRQLFLSTATGLPKTMQPFAHLRFTRIFAPDHPINSLAVGLVTTLKGRLTLCTVDVWDAVRQFQLYSGARQLSR